MANLSDTELSYTVQYLVEHLIISQDYENLYEILLDIYFLQCFLDTEKFLLEKGKELGSPIHLLLRQFEIAIKSLPDNHNLGNQLRSLFNVINNSSYVRAEREPILTNVLNFTPHIYNSLITDWDKDSKLGQNLIEAVSNYSSPWLKRISHKKIVGNTKQIYSCEFSKDGRYLAAGGEDESVTIWDSSDRKIKQKIQVGLKVFSLSFSPGGSLLAVGADQGHICICNVELGQVIFKVIGHTSRVMSVVFSPKGENIISTSFDGVVRKWNYPFSFYSKSPDYESPIVTVPGR